MAFKILYQTKQSGDFNSVYEEILFHGPKRKSHHEAMAFHAVFHFVPGLTKTTKRNNRKKQQNQRYEKSNCEMEKRQYHFLDSYTFTGSRIEKKNGSVNQVVSQIR